MVMAPYRFSSAFYSNNGKSGTQRKLVGPGDEVHPFPHEQPNIPESLINLLRTLANEHMTSPGLVESSGQWLLLPSFKNLTMGETSLLRHLIQIRPFAPKIFAVSTAVSTSFLESFP